MKTRETLDQAVEVFARGFAFTRSIAHPYVLSRVKPAWVLRDGPRTSGGLRNEEWITCDVPAKHIDRLVQRHACGRYVISAILPAGESSEPFCAEFKTLGYRLMTTEALMVHGLRRIPREVAPVVIERVTTLERAEELRRTSGRRQILPEHVTTDLASPLRAYVALEADRIVGWVLSVPVGGATWVSSMFVQPACRRRGIGRALLGAMLRDDRTAGAQTSVLLASHTGAKLYPRVGYRVIGTLYLFTPPRAGKKRP